MIASRTDPQSKQKMEMKAFLVMFALAATPVVADVGATGGK